MKTLTEKSNKTLQSLIKKNSFEGGRMPTLKNVSLLLTELNIEHKLESSTETKSVKSSGSRVFTRGGTKVYTGYTLTINNVSGGQTQMSTTCSYYSMNTRSYTMMLLEIINNK